MNLENKLAGYFIHEDATYKDGLLWSESCSGAFSIKFACALSFGSQQGSYDNVWREIWRIEVPHRVRFFLCPVKHQRIMCNFERASHGFTIVSTC